MLPVALVQVDVRAVRLERMGSIFVVFTVSE